MVKKKVSILTTSVFYVKFLIGGRLIYTFLLPYLEFTWHSDGKYV